MALPTSGPISIRDILREMGRSDRTTNLNTLASEWYEKTRLEVFNKTSHSLSDWRGKEWNTIPPPKDSLVITSSLYDGSSVAVSFPITIVTNRAWVLRELEGGVYTTLSKTSGSGSTTVIFSLPSNKSTFRAGRIEFVAGDAKATFRWSQSSGLPGGGGGDDGPPNL